MRVLLISTYEMGRQPFGLASPAAWLQREGIDVRCIDVAKEPLDVLAAASANLIAFHLPMHTATRLAAPIIEKVRALNPAVCIAAYGVYAPLNAEWLRSLGVDEILGGEFEEALTAVARDVDRRGGACLRPDGPRQARPLRPVPRLNFVVPDRSTLPPLTRYATLQMPDGRRKIVGYTEASRGCRHLCRHCPIVPIYNGQFRIVPPDVVLADISAQVAAGAEHITFGDPDFFNGPAHAMRIVEAMHAAHPQLTYDVTIKVEHLLRHDALVDRLRDTGCLFVTSAVESIDDRVLTALQKDHTREDFHAAVRLCRGAGVTLVPTFVAFHPWISLEGYCELLDTIEALDLIDQVAPIQLAIRLLIPEGSRLLELGEIREVAQQFDQRTLAYPWVHPDPRVDRLHDDIASIVGRRLSADRAEVFDEISSLAHDRAGVGRPDSRPIRNRATVPYLNEPWYC